MVVFITWVIPIERVALQFSNKFIRPRWNYLSELIAVLWSRKSIDISFTKSQCFKSFCDVAEDFEINVGNDNIVLTLSNVAQINFEIDNIDSTLFNVVNFRFDIRNIVSTLIWRCTTLKRLLGTFWICKWFANAYSVGDYFSLKPMNFQLNMYITWRKLIFLVLQTFRIMNVLKCFPTNLLHPFFSIK